MSRKPILKHGPRKKSSDKKVTFGLPPLDPSILSALAKIAKQPAQQLQEVKHTTPLTIEIPNDPESSPIEILDSPSGTVSEQKISEISTLSNEREVRDYLSNAFIKIINDKDKAKIKNLKKLTEKCFVHISQLSPSTDTAAKDRETIIQLLTLAEYQTDLAMMLDFLNMTRAFIKIRKEYREQLEKMPHMKWIKYFDTEQKLWAEGKEDFVLCPENDKSYILEKSSTPLESQPQSLEPVPTVLCTPSVTPPINEVEKSAQEDKTTFSIMNLTAQQINQLLIAIRYDAIEPFLESKDLKENNLTGLCIKTFLGYGRTHSKQPFRSGLFYDNYTREPLETEIFTENQSNCLASYNFTKVPNEGLGILVQDEPILYDIEIQLRKCNLTKYYKVITFLGRKIGFLKLESLDEMPLFPGVPLCDLLASKRKELRTLCNKYLMHFGLYQHHEMSITTLIKTPHFKKILEKLINHTNKDSGIPSAVLKGTYQSAVDPQKVINHIFTTLEKFKESSREHFYFNLIEKLYKNTKPREHLETLEKQQLHASLNRLAFILDIAAKRYKEKDILFLLLGFAFDECLFQKMLSPIYNDREIIQIFERFYQDTYQLKEAPTSITLTSSGMHGISNLLHAAIKTIKDKKPENAKIKIYLEENSYYQTPRVLQGIISSYNPVSKFFGQEVLINWLDSKTTEESFNPNQSLVDVMICSFEQNPTPKTACFSSNNISEKIILQFKLREKKNYDQPLIVFIDLTASSIEKDYLSNLLSIHTNEIRKGKLAILTVLSLNKYFLVGFDKLPAGLTASFFNADSPHFEYLKKIKEQQHFLRGFETEDPTVQMLAHFTKHMKPEIINYSQQITKNARYLYQSLIPKKLLHPTSDSFIWIDRPYTIDLSKNCWGFVAIKLNWKINSGDPAKKTITKLLAACKSMGILERDGYGYGYTTYNKFILEHLEGDDKELSRINHEEVLRISIGMESEEELIKIFTPLVIYINSVEKAIQHITDMRLFEAQLNRIDMQWNKMLKDNSLIDPSFIIDSKILSDEKLTLDQPGKNYNFSLLSLLFQKRVTNEEIFPKEIIAQYIQIAISTDNIFLLEQVAEKFKFHKSYTSSALCDCLEKWSPSSLSAATILLSKGATATQEVLNKLNEKLLQTQDKSLSEPFKNLFSIFTVKKPASSLKSSEESTLEIAEVTSKPGINQDTLTKS